MLPAVRYLAGLSLALAVIAAVADMVRGRVRVRGSSMVPTLLPGDTLLTSRLLLRLRGVRRGDIVLLARRPPGDPERLDLKRVIGLPGDRVSVEERGTVLINGVPLAEPYAEMPDGTAEAGAWQVGAGEMFVLGDHRAFSTDSRSYGPVALALVEGIVWWRVGPEAR